MRFSNLYVKRNSNNLVENLNKNTKNLEYNNIN
jgi:hypothetical protein